MRYVVVRCSRDARDRVGDGDARFGFQRFSRALRARADGVM
jgi:hypothetical protein